MLKHFVLTRLGLGIFSEAWFERHIDLFDAVTFSSLANQSSQDFHYLLVVDVGLRGAPRTRLEKQLATRPNFHLVTTDVTRMTDMHLGQLSWMYRPCHDYMLERGLVTDPSEYIITSAIDADDAWHRDFIARVNTLAAYKLPALTAIEPARPTFLANTAGLAMTFQNGLRWFLPHNATEPMASQFHSSTVSILARFSSGVSAWSSRHIAWPYMAYILLFDTINTETAHPMWLYLRHSGTTQPWSARHLAPAGRSKLDELHTLFGIDPEKVERWIAADRALPGEAHHHSGRPLRDQVDRMFRLTALNRQIDILDRALSNPQLDQTERQQIEELVRAQKTKRTALIEELHRARSDDYA